MRVFNFLSPRNSVPLILIGFVCAGTIILPIAIGGLHASGDLGVYLSFAQEYQQQIIAGHLFPSWANDNFGFGNVGIRFYPPVASYVSVFIELLTGSWYYSLWLYFFGWMLVGSIGAYLFVKEFCGTYIGALAGVLYALVPFPLAEIYLYSLYAEFAAGSLVSFCFLFLARICKHGRWTDVFLFATSFGLLILTHIPTTIIASLSFVVFVPFLLERQRLKRTVLQLLTSILLALLASLFYWIKVITEIQWLSHNEPKYSTGLAGYREWIFPTTLLHHNTPSFYSPVYRNLDAIIVLTMLLTIPFLYLTFIDRNRAKEIVSRIDWALAATLVFGFFMLSSLSESVWSVFTTLQKIQFPWRWLTVLSVTGTFSFVIAVGKILRYSSHYRGMFILTIAIVISFILAFDIRQSFASPNRISIAEFEELDNTKSYPEGTSFEAWWPIWARKKAFEERKQVTAGDRPVEVSSWETENREFTISEGQPVNIRVSTFYYPYWQAFVNGTKIDVNMDDNGVIILPVGRERSSVTLQFKEPESNIIARWISIAVWILLAVQMGRHLKRKLKADSCNARVKRSTLESASY